MKINFDAVLTQIDGSEIKDGDTPVTLKMVAVKALMEPDGREPREATPATEKVARIDLALRIYGSEGELDIKPEDATLIKKFVGKFPAPLIVHRAFKLLDG